MKSFTKSHFAIMKQLLKCLFPEEDQELCSKEDACSAVLQLVKLAGYCVRDVCERSEYQCWKRDMNLKKNGPEEDMFCISGYLCVNHDDKVEAIRASYWFEKVWKILSDAPYFARMYVLETEVRASIPLEPIIVSPHGDVLREKRIGYERVQHLSGGHDIDPYYIVHGTCTEKGMDLIRAPRTDSVLVCRDCFLRIPFPNKVTTYADLRAHFYHLQRLRWTR